MAVRELNRYVPASYQLAIEEPELGIQVYIDAERICAMGFAGRRNNPDFRYRFNNMAQLNAYVEEFVARIRNRAEYQQQRRAERVAANRNAVVNVGDIFQAMWGYDQTNIDYFQVVAVRGQMMDVRPIRALSEGNGLPDQGVCVPAPNNFIGERVRRVRIQASGESIFFRFASYANAYRIQPVAVVAGVPIFEQANWTAYA